MSPAGALACAEVLNPGPTYVRIPTDQLPDLGRFDLIYSFAVFQHLGHQRAVRAFEELRAALRAGGLALIHLPMGQRQPPHTRLRRYRMHYDRFPESDLRETLRHFSGVTIRPIAELCKEDEDDVSRQHVVAFTATAQLTRP